MKRNNDVMLNMGGSDFIDKTFEEHLKERKIIINSEVTQDLIETVILQIMKFNKEDKDIPVCKRKPIRLYISSGGGDVFTGLGVVDTIINSKTKIQGLVLTYGYSMGAVIFSACHERFMMPTASLLIHDGQTSLSGSANKVKDIQKFYNRIDDKLKEVIVSKSKITKQEYEENMDRELYMIADECKEKGLCDFIIGVDCELDEII
jgi:ATP-dependent Clp protease, protease subunit